MERSWAAKKGADRVGGEKRGGRRGGLVSLYADGRVGRFRPIQADVAVSRDGQTP